MNKRVSLVIHERTRGREQPFPTYLWSRLLSPGGVIEAGAHSNDTLHGFLENTINPIAG